ncbi:MAG: hypothetical protein ACE5IJ_00850 [Thermoplasmata archaeon]
MRELVKVTKRAEEEYDGSLEPLELTDGAFDEIGKDHRVKDWTHRSFDRRLFRLTVSFTTIVTTDIPAILSLDRFPD